MDSLRNAQAVRRRIVSRFGPQRLGELALPRLWLILKLTLATLFQNCGGGPQSPTMDNSLASHLVATNPYFGQQNISVDVMGLTQITVSLANHGIYFSDLVFSNLALGTASSGPTVDLNLQANVIPIEDIPCPPPSAGTGPAGTTLNLSPV